MDQNLVKKMGNGIKNEGFNEWQIRIDRRIKEKNLVTKDQDYYKSKRNFERKDGVWDKLQIRIERGYTMIIQKKKIGVEAKCRLGLL